MLYRRFPKGNEELSILGFGCMRLPLNSERSDDINTEEATRMIRSAIDRGVNYIDTAYPYHGKMSEPLVAHALSDGYRKKVALATKLPCWMVEKHEDFDHFLDDQLERLQTEKIDYYLIHALDKERWKKMVELDIFSFLERAQEDGRVAHMGFSFHDDLETFKQIVDGYRWHFCQIQYNYLDTNVQAGSEGLEYAYERGLGIIVMEPLRGGALTGTIPDDVKRVWDAAPSSRTPAEWALRWVWDDPRVTVVLSGMSTQDQVDENVVIADEALPHRLSSEELSSIEQVRSIYKKRIVVDCTACGYCMPCPHGVDIPSAFRFYNNAMMFEEPIRFRQEYVRFNSEHLSNLCIECGECEPQCPQHIPIIKSLKNVTEYFLTE